MVHTPNGLGQLTTMRPFYTPSPLRQGATAVFGTEEEQGKAEQAANQRKVSFARERRLSATGTMALVEGINPQIRQVPIDRFLRDYNATQFVGPDFLMRGMDRPSMVDAANAAAEREKEEGNPVWQINRFVNQNPLAAVAIIAAVYWLSARAASKRARSTGKR